MIEAPSCLSEDEILAFVQLDLDEAARRRVEEHIRGCGPCRAVVSAAAEELGLGATLRGGGPAAPIAPARELLAGCFELRSLAGAGGMGRVFRGVDRRNGGDIAVKFLHSTAALDLLRFEREARVLSQIRHAAIVRYVASGVVGDRPYLVTDWVEGETLSARLARTTLTRAEALGVTRQIADALSAAHEAGIVHRDLKPGNVMLADRRLDSVRLIDFGLARDAAPSNLTRTGVVLGTPGFMSPEQVRGERATAATTDLFALGCVLFLCLTARPAFPGGDVLSVLLKTVYSDPLEGLESSSGVEDLLRRLLAKSPSDRPPSARDVSDEISRLLVEIDRPRAPAPRDARFGGVEQRALALVAVSSDRPTVAPAVLREIAERAGGRLEELADGSLAIAFGSGADPDELVLRAARCAAELRDHVDGALALASGRAEIGAHRVTGEVIRRVTTLLDLGDRDHVRLDETTAAVLRSRFHVDRDQAGAFLARERSPDDEALSPFDRATPFVGRERELRELEAAFAECASESLAQAVIVQADAGVGKSRLARELVRLVRARCDVEVWIGRGDPMRAGAPFGLLADALRGAAGIVAGDPRATQRAKLARRIGRAPNVELGPLERMMGFDPEDGPASSNPLVAGDRIRRAFVELVATECADHPMIVVLEDLQWGDAPTVDLVDSLLAEPALRLLVVALARPEIEQRFGRPWSARRSTELRLTGLSRRASKRLVGEVLGSRAGVAVQEELASRAAGNAFFLEELLRVWSLGATALPESVLLVAEARLAEVDDPARRALRAASVLGQRFAWAGVASILGDAAVEAHRETFASLVERGIVFDADRRGKEAAFRHAILREAAYVTLTDDDRRLGHRRAAEYLRDSGDGDPRTIAAHFEQGGDPRSAIEPYVRACERALAANDFESVIALAERGIACGADGSTHGDLRRCQAEAARLSGRLRDALRYAEEAVAAPGGDARSRSSAIAELALVRGVRGEIDELPGLALSLPPAASDAGPRRVLALGRIARYLVIDGRGDVAEPIFAEVERCADAAAGDAEVALEILRARATRAFYRGDLASYLAWSEQQIATGERSGDRRAVSFALASTGFAYLVLGALEEADRFLRRAKAMAEQLGVAGHVRNATLELAAASARRGDLHEARELYRLAVEAGVAATDPRTEVEARSGLARTLVGLDDPAAAEREARAAIEVGGALPPARAGALASLARALLARGDAAAALEAASGAVELVEALPGLHQHEASVRLVHARALLACGVRDRAAAAIQRAETRLRARAERIEDAAWRSSFLERVEEHVEIIALARVLAAER